MSAKSAGEPHCFDPTYGVWKKIPQGPLRFAQCTSAFSCFLIIPTAVPSSLTHACVNPPPWKGPFLFCRTPHHFIQNTPGESSPPLLGAYHPPLMRPTLRLPRHPRGHIWGRDIYGVPHKIQRRRKKNNGRGAKGSYETGVI